jgi:putative iron-dependent peroxidase
MSLPQPGIFALGTASHAYLEYDLAPGASGSELISVVANMREPRTTIGGVNLVCGFRPELWAATFPDEAPAGTHGFNEAVVGPEDVVFPATQHDAVIWLTGGSYDLVFDVSHAVTTTLLPIAGLAHELVGWPYHADRDLTGFIDGTENPTLVEATAVVMIPEGSRGAGGSVLLLQQWEHDVMDWEALGVDAQEQVMGRRKSDSEELDPRPEDSHVARNDQDEFGKIFRRNIGWGTMSEHGTIFSGFSADQGILERMLRSMAGLDGSPPDALTRFTTALTGAYYFVPSAEQLAGAGSSP